MVIGYQEIDAFAARLRGEERSAATVEKYCREAARFAAWLAGREVSQLLALEYKAYRLPRPGRGEWGGSRPQQVVFIFRVGGVQAQGGETAAADFPGRGAGADRK